MSYLQKRQILSTEVLYPRLLICKCRLRTQSKTDSEYCICKNVYLLFDFEFMLSAFAGGNMEIYALHDFYSNVEGDGSKTRHIVETCEQRMCSE